MSLICMSGARPVAELMDAFSFMKSVAANQWLRRRSKEPARASACPIVVLKQPESFEGEVGVRCRSAVHLDDALHQSHGLVASRPESERSESLGEFAQAQRSRSHLSSCIYCSSLPDRRSPTLPMIRRQHTNTPQLHTRDLWRHGGQSRQSITL